MNDRRRMSTHRMGVLCQECKAELVPDTCCADQKHGHTFQQPSAWAARTWPDHPCFTEETP